MNIMQYTDASTFCEQVLPYLLQSEAENNLMIGIMLRLADGTGKWGDEPPVLCAVEEQGQVVAAAVQTPPYNLQLTRMNEAMQLCLVEYLQAIGHALPGVLGPKMEVAAFTERWIAGTSLYTEHAQGMGVYQLDTVILPEYPGGYAEQATAADTTTLLPWLDDFNQHTGADRRSAEEVVGEALAHGRYWVWRNPHPVSLAGCCGSTPHGIRIGPVYTPAEHRGKGYASANVAALSQHQLKSGREFCYLFTDLANPTANSIYQKIGYRRVCDFATYRFAQAQL